MVIPRPDWTEISIAEIVAIPRCGIKVSGQVMKRAYDKNTALNPIGIATAVRMKAAMATA
jgi:hypothetical protein